MFCSNFCRERYQIILTQTSPPTEYGVVGFHLVKYRPLEKQLINEIFRSATFLLSKEDRILTLDLSSKEVEVETEHCQFDVRLKEGKQIRFKQINGESLVNKKVTATIAIDERDACRFDFHIAAGQKDGNEMNVMVGDSNTYTQHIQGSGGDFSPGKVDNSVSSSHI